MKMKQELDARLRPSEAIAITAELLAQFPSCKAENGFIKAVSEYLAAQPKAVAQLITDPLRGLASQVEFLSLKRIADWCDARAKPLHEELARLSRHASQTEERSDWHAPKPQSLLAAGKAWLDRTDPVSRKLIERTSPIASESTEDRERFRELQGKRTKEIEAEWARAGRTPARIGGLVVSIELHDLCKSGGEQEAVADPDQAHGDRQP